MMDIPDLKHQLRRAMRERRSQIPEPLRQEQSLAASLLAEREVLGPLRHERNRPLTVFIYASFRDEPDTSELMNNCWRQGDRVLVPKVIGAGRFELHELKEAGELLPGAWGIPEPAEHTGIWPENRWSEIDLVVVPGLAYDRAGGRIGFGGGFYDRFMDALQRSEGGGAGAIIGALAFQEQILTDCIPMEPHDFRVELLFTASGTIYINESSEKFMSSESQEGKLTHFNEQGRANMVDISGKQSTARTAVAVSTITMHPDTLRAIKEGQVGKGDVLAVAQIAGIQGAKKTSDWIPMCHPLPLTGVNLIFTDNGHNELHIEATVKTEGKTGVEMEALTAVSAAALTVYDMCKALQKDMVIGPTLLRSKTGGKSGNYLSGF